MATISQEEYARRRQEAGKRLFSCATDSAAGRQAADNLSVALSALDQGADPNALFDVTITDDGKESQRTIRQNALHGAIKTGQIEMYKALLNHGGDLNLANSEGITGFCLAMTEGGMADFDLAMQSRPDPNGTTVAPRNYLPDIEGKEIGYLHLAVRQTRIPRVEGLLAAGADPKKTIEMGGEQKAPLDFLREDLLAERDEEVLDIAALVRRYADLPRHAIIDDPSAPCDRKSLVTPREDGKIPMENPLLWQHFDAVEAALEKAGTPLEKQDVFMETGEGKPVLAHVADAGAMPRLVGYLNANGESLSVAEMAENEQLAPALRDKQVVESLFSFDNVKTRSVSDVTNDYRCLDATAQSHVALQQLMLAVKQHQEKDQPSRGR